MLIKSKSMLGVLAVFACSSQSIATETYRVTIIGVDFVYSMALNERNEVVGYVLPNGTWSESYAFLWRWYTGLQSIGGYAARDINEFGQIAGNSDTYQAAVWENGSWMSLPGRQNAVAINDNTQVAGLISAQPFLIPGPYAPFRDDDIYSTSFIVLERPYEYASHGMDINNHGEVVADCGGNPNGLYVGVFYESDTNLIILDDDGNYDVHPRSINDASQIVGNSRIFDGGDLLAVFWDTPESAIEYMGSLGGGVGIASAINNIGQAVGRSAGRAFLWSEKRGMLDLNAMIDARLRITLTWATDINDHGAIVARGIDSIGQENSYLLTPLSELSSDLSISSEAHDASVLRGDEQK